MRADSLSFDIRSFFKKFMDFPDVYQDHVQPIPGSREGVAALRGSGHEVLFVTSIGKFHNSYASKAAWLYENFPGCRIATLSSDIKHYMAGDAFVDDRADTCLRVFYSGNVRRTVLFEQPWSYADPTREQFKSLQDTVERFRPEGWGTEILAHRGDWADLVRTLVRHP